MTSSASPESNFRTIESLALHAARLGSAMLCLPESFDYLTSPSSSPSLSHSLSGPLLSRYHALSSRTGLWLSLGGFHERHPLLPATHCFNTHVLLAPTSPSRPAAVYRKLHLFDAVLPSGRRVSEARSTAPGQQLVVARNTPIGDVGLSTCYDLRFPALYEALRNAGAHVLLVPSAFFPATGAAHWHVLLRARAIENQCYVAAAAQVGRHEHARRDSYGHALIVEPFGHVLADAGPEDSPVVVTAAVEPHTIDRVRTDMPVRRHRRDDVLGPIVEL